MSAPNFLVLGAQKAGTTWLADMLRQHPQICMPEKKEIHFFNKRENYQKGFDWYEEHFEACNEPVRGEATPNYFWTSRDEEEIRESGRTKNIPELVQDAYPDLQFIVSLRDPVDRAVSAYRTLVRAGYVAPRKSILEVAHHYGIVSIGDYQTHIDRWFEHFSRSQFLFLIFEEDIKSNRRSTVTDMYRFLDVDSAFMPENIDVRKHPSLGSFYGRLLYYAPWIRNMVKNLFPELNRDRIPFRDLLDRKEVSDQERSELIRYFEGKNQGLDDLIGRKPRNWASWTA
jgi:hypothetical protein